VKINTKDSENSALLFEGSMLLPCGLKFNIVHVNEGIESFLLEIPFDFESENETNGKGYVNSSLLALNGRYYAFLLYGLNSSVSSDRILFLSVGESEEADVDNKNRNSNSYLWAIVFIVLGVAFLVLIIIIVIVLVKKKKNRVRLPVMDSELDNFHDLNFDRGGGNILGVNNEVTDTRGRGQAIVLLGALEEEDDMREDEDHQPSFHFIQRYLFICLLIYI
jgi:hypothetical protein